MGYVRHNAIIVSSWDRKALARAHGKAKEIFDVCPVSPKTREVVNGYSSFFIAPDGSKEGWASSNKGDQERDEFISYLKEQEYDDGSNRLGWVLIQFSGDELDTKVVDSSDHRRRRIKE